MNSFLDSSKMRKITIVILKINFSAVKKKAIPLKKGQKIPFQEKKNISLSSNP